MHIQKRAIAGTLESSDAMVEVLPAESGLQLEIESVVFDQYGDAIKAVAQDTLNRLGVDQGRVLITDRGAIDCVLAARVEAAVLRAGRED